MSQQTLHRLSEDVLDVLFREARTFSGWQDRPVADETLREIYELMKYGPTSVNGNPARLVFLRSKEAKQRLLPALAPGNVDKTMSAPVTVIIAHDFAFYEKIPQLLPQAPQYRDLFADTPELAQATAFRNGSLQGGYFILAARSLGLDCGALSGFDNARVDEEFFGAGTSQATEEFVPASHVRSNFLCNLGYGDRTTLHPRNPRLAFEEACTLL